MNPAVLSSSTSIYVAFMASVLIWFLFLGLAILWVIDGKIKKEIVLHALLSVLVAWAISEMIKTVFPTLRPFEVNGRVPLTLTLIDKGAAFPSAHTAIAFALSTTVYLHDRKAGIFFLIGSIVVGIGRVWGNVHYPIDVAGGIIIGSLTAFVIDKVHLYNLVSGKRK